MQIRPAHPSDLDHLIDLDATIESTSYLHVDRAGEGLATGWRLEERPLREKRVDPNHVTEEQSFALKQVLSGIEEGIGVAVDHDGVTTGLAVARLDHQRRTLDLLELRVDFEYRRRGWGRALLDQIISHAASTDVCAATA